MSVKGVVGRRNHFAHVVSLKAHEGVLLATSAVIASFLAPVSGRVVPFKGFLAGSVTHASMVVSSVSESRHIIL